MDFLSAGLGIAGEFASAAMGQRYQDKMLHEQMDYNTRQYATRYQTTVADLQKAGLNPMLAYTQGAGSAPSSGVPQGAKPDFASAMNSTRLATAQEAKTDQETKIGAAQEQNIIWDTVNKKLQPALTAMQTMDVKAKMVYTQELTSKIQFEINQLLVQQQEIYTRIENNKSDTNLKNQQLVVERSLAELNAAKIILTQAQASGQKLENIIATPKAAAAETWTGETAAKAENVKKIIQTITEPVGDILKIGIGRGKLQGLPKYPKKAGD